MSEHHDRNDAERERTRPADRPRITKGSKLVKYRLLGPPGVVDVLRTVAVRYEASPARVAIGWLLARPAVTSVIAGVRRLEQFAGSVAAGDVTVTGQDLAGPGGVSRPPAACPDWIRGSFSPVRIPGSGVA